MLSLVTKHHCSMAGLLPSCDDVTVPRVSPFFDSEKV